MDSSVSPERRNLVSARVASHFNWPLTFRSFLFALSLMVLATVISDTMGLILYASILDLDTYWLSVPTL